jgi:hypothetical protein
MLRHGMPACALNGHLASRISLEISISHMQQGVRSDTCLAESYEFPAHLPSTRRTSQSAPSALGVSTRQGLVGIYRKRFHRKGSKAAK